MFTRKSVPKNQLAQRLAVDGDTRRGGGTLNCSLRPSSGQNPHGADHEIAKELVSRGASATVLAEVRDLGGGTGPRTGEG